MLSNAERRVLVIHCFDRAVRGLAENRETRGLAENRETSLRKI